MGDQLGDRRGRDTDLTWTHRAEQWSRFAAWEAEQLRSAPSDFHSAIRWFADAWALAARLDPSWTSRDRAEEHWRHLHRVRAALARMRSRS